ncbi:MAG: glutathione S-transferase N-terminal domain-containing protein [Rhizobiaceae bacterium]|nr:glutathione S-transferase N-terminal domain-containing protein [Rhizobiaceae bacterium]
MMQFYYHPSPNPAKVALLLEELGAPYELVPVDTRKGEQFSADFLKINPNAKTPALVDGEAVLFDSSAILLYLAETTGRFLPENTPARRAELLSWLMFVASGIGPYSGQSVHFSHMAPEKLPYAINRYGFEVERHYGIVDERLGQQRYMVGETYTIADMAVWGWARLLPFVFGEAAWTRFPNIKRLVDEIDARPAAQKAIALKERHAFKTEMDEEAKRNMFPQNARLAG